MKTLPKLGKGELDGLDEYSNTALYYAAMFSKLVIIELLLQYGANPNTSNENGNAPLH